MFKLPNGKTIDEEMVMMGMEDADLANAYYLDLETGEIEIVSAYDVIAEEEFEKFENENFVKIPQLPSWQQYKWMKEFVEEIIEKENPSLAEKLSIALDGKGAFRRFKMVLEKEENGWLDAWYSWKDEYVYEELRSWLKELPVKTEEEFEFFDACAVCDAMKHGASEDQLIKVMEEINDFKEEKRYEN